MTSGGPDVAALQTLPIWPEDPLPAIRAVGATWMVLALDDDPTGTQTVRDVPVLTRWDVPMLQGLRAGHEPLAFLLTNSRALPVEDAALLATRIGHQLREAAGGAAGSRRWSVVSRSDSTLRGHYPAEVDALAEALGVSEARIVLAPFFADGGRITVGGVHYLRRDGALTPVAETEFARDTVFGYASSDLAGWVAERTAARPGSPSRPVRQLGLRDIREGGPNAVRDAFLDLPPRAVMCVDAAEERDIEVVALGVLLAERDGLPVVGRTAASYVRARAGLPAIAPLAGGEFPTGSPGLVVIGSHVPTTTSQLQRLLADRPIELRRLDVDVEGLLGASERHRTDRVGDLARTADELLAAGTTPVITTSRTLVRGGDSRQDLAIAALVSETLMAVVRRIGNRPAWVVAKGGITSSDMATHGLGMDVARIVGPLMPGVPLWRAGDAARWPGMHLLVFPGNVGGPDTLREAVARLAGVA